MQSIRSTNVRPSSESQFRPRIWICLFLLTLVCVVACDFAPSDQLSVKSPLPKAVSLTVTESAHDWPQILGPNRNGIVVNEKLTEWGTAGPIQNWSREVGEGYAGPVVVDNHVLIFHRPDGRKGKSYLLEKLDADTGQPAWQKEIKANYHATGPDPDCGPKATPLVHEGLVYLFAPGGDLYCVKFDDGEIVWKLDALKKYKTNFGYFGCGSTPIIADNKLILNVGGKEHSVVAFDLKSGDEIWTAFQDNASYSSPVSLQVGDREVVYVLTRLFAIAIDPTDGAVLSKFPFGKRGPTAVGPMPVAVGEKVFLNSSYGVGSFLLDLGKEKLDGGEATAVWSNPQFNSQYTTPVLLDGHCYGTIGREDQGKGSFACIDLSTGEIKWKGPPVSIGHSLLVGDKVLTMECKGTLSVVAADPSGHKLIHSVSVFPKEVGSRAVPAISSGRFFTRSNAKGGKGVLVCLQVGEVEK